MATVRPHETKVYPPAVPQPCNDCPWRKEAKAKWLGPYLPREWIAIVHSESPIACHQTIRNTDIEGHGDWDDPSMRQCMGAAMFRHNVGKRPRNPSIAWQEADDNILESNEDFMDLHDPHRDNGELVTGDLFDMLPRED